MIRPAAVDLPSSLLRVSLYTVQVRLDPARAMGSRRTSLAFDHSAYSAHSPPWAILDGDGRSHLSSCGILVPGHQFGRTHLRTCAPTHKPAHTIRHSDARPRLTPASSGVVRCTRCDMILLHAPSDIAPDMHSPLHSTTTTTAPSTTAHRTLTYYLPAHVLHSSFTLPSGPDLFPSSSTLYTTGTLVSSTTPGHSHPLSLPLPLAGSPQSVSALSSPSPYLTPLPPLSAPHRDFSRLRRTSPTTPHCQCSVPRRRSPRHGNARRSQTLSD